MLLETFFAVSLVAPGYSLLRIIGTRMRNGIEQLVLSYVLSLLLMFVLLYAGGILMSFFVASFIFAAISGLSVIYIIGIWIKDSHSLASLKTRLNNISTEEIILFTAISSLIAVYSVVLLTRALLDSDVVQYYLPFAREIVDGNGFTYSTGYDYNTFLKPIGASVIYAWTYVIAGSSLAETFRLMPLVPIFIMALVTYSIAKEVTDSQRIGTIAAVIFMVLPFHDRFLYYNAFYPDTFYYPLIFFVIMGILRYSKTRNIKWLFVIGCALGIAGLIKAQTILYALALLLCLVVIEIKDKKLVFLTSVLTPFAILIPNIVAEIGSPSGTGLLIGAQSCALMLFAALFVGVMYIVLEPGSVTTGISADAHDKIPQEPLKEDSSTLPQLPDITKVEKPGLIKALLGFVFRALCLIIPFALLASLWYINNLLRYGSLIYTSSVDIPNFAWAIDIVNSILPSEANAEFSYYFLYFFFLFVDPAVVGYIWLVPLLIGFAIAYRLRSTTLRILMFFTIVVIALVFSQTAYYINPYMSSVVNPRDLLPISILLSIISSIAFSFVSSLNRQALNFRESLLISITLAAYFGAMSYFHSVYLYFAAIVLPGITNPISGFLSVFNLTLQETSFQLSPFSRVTFVTTHLVSILLLSFVVAIPLFLLIFSKAIRPTKHSSVRQQIGMVKEIRNYLWQFLSRIPQPRLSGAQTKAAKSLLLVFLVVGVITVPRSVILASQGGPYQSSTYQLSSYYGPIYELMIDYETKIHGDILTYAAPAGLPYYMPNVNVIDLRYAANLAYLRECFNSTTTYESTIALKQKGIQHLLFNLASISELDNALNNTLTSIMANTSYSTKSQTYGSWILYDLGPFEISKTVITPDDWVIDSRYTTGPSYFENNETGIFLGLISGASADRIAIVNSRLPRLNLSDFQYLSVNVSGIDNARILFRFYLDNGTPVDVAYWKSPSQITDLNLEQYGESRVRGDAYVSLMSSNGEPTFLRVIEISFAKMVPISNRYLIPPESWSLDARYTNGSFSFESNEAGLRLELLSGFENDRLTIANYEIPKFNRAECDHILVRMTGTSNARVFLRLYIEDGTNIDIAYWVAPTYFYSIIPIPPFEGMFRGDAFIGLISSDGMQCSVTITEIALLQVY